MRWLAVVPWVVLLHVGVAHADAVGPCPPGFRASHRGCEVWNPVRDPRPSELELGTCACCVAAIGVLGAIGGALALRSRRASGSREG